MEDPPVNRRLRCGRYGQGSWAEDDSGRRCRPWSPGHPLLRPGMAERTGELDGRIGGAYGFPNVAIRSIRHSKSTRFSSMAGSRSP